MSDTTAQVRITNTFTNNKGTVIEQVLSIKQSALLPYLNSLRNEANKRYSPNRSKEFDHLPLLSVWDFADTGEEYLFTEDELPEETVYNSKGIAILIIIPEDAKIDADINLFEHLPEEKKVKMKEYLKSKPRNSFISRPENIKKDEKKSKK